MERKIEITTERLTLRPLQAEDIPALVDGLNDYAVSKWLTVVPFPYEREDAQEFLDFLGDKDPLAGLGIIAPEGLVGVVGIDNGLGYWLRRSAHGKGYMSEAARAVVDRFFTNGDADSLGSGYFDGNAASANVLTKLGFRPAGEERVKSRAQGAEVTLKKVILTRSEWGLRSG